MLEGPSQDVQAFRRRQTRLVVSPLSHSNAVRSRAAHTPRLVPMRTLVTREFTFEAAHSLPWHQGKCARLHGHSYRLVVTVEGPLDERGVVLDFADLSTLVATHVLERFDHQHLNKFFDNPTAEIVANDIFVCLNNAGLALTRVVLWETANSYVTVEK